MIDEAKWIELAKAEDEAFFRGDLVLSLPEGSYTADEMWEVLMDMFRTSIRTGPAKRRSPPWTRTRACRSSCAAR